MRGSYTILLSSKRIKYELTVKRKVTIIRGDSATGKSVFLTYLQHGLNKGAGISFSSKVKCRIISGPDWERDIMIENNRILFFEEDDVFVYSEDFARIVRDSHNYFVIVTRYDLPNIPYSVEEVFNLRQSGKYNEFISEFTHDVSAFKPTHVITEDSQEGFRAYNNTCSDKIKCISSHGNSNILNIIRELCKSESKGARILIVVDGAAFGPYINRLQEFILADKDNKYRIYAPESFEYMILGSAMFRNVPHIQNFLTNTADYADTSFFSWERYYTHLLGTLTEGSICHYSDKSPNPCFSQDCCCRPNNPKCQFFLSGNKCANILSEPLEIFDFSGEKDTGQAPDVVFTKSNVF